MLASMLCGIAIVRGMPIVATIFGIDFSYLM